MHFIRKHSRKKNTCWHARAYLLYVSKDECLEKKYTNFAYGPMSEKSTRCQSATRPPLKGKVLCHCCSECCWHLDKSHGRVKERPEAKKKPAPAKKNFEMCLSPHALFAFKNYLWKPTLARINNWKLHFHVAQTNFFGLAVNETSRAWFSVLFLNWDPFSQVLKIKFKPV